MLKFPVVYRVGSPSTGPLLRRMQPTQGKQSQIIAWGCFRMANLSSRLPGKTVVMKVRYQVSDLRSTRFQRAGVE